MLSYALLSLVFLKTWIFFLFLFFPESIIFFPMFSSFAIMHDCHNECCIGTNYFCYHGHHCLSTLVKGTIETQVFGALTSDGLSEACSKLILSHNTKQKFDQVVGCNPEKS